MDKNEKKRLVNLWEDGINFQPLLLESSAYEGVSFHSANKPIPFFGMETERKITSKEKNFCYTIRHIYIFSIERRKVIRHTKAKKFKKANAALHKIIRCLNKYDYKTEAVIHSRIKMN